MIKEHRQRASPIRTAIDQRHYTMPLADTIKSLFESESGVFREIFARETARNVAKRRPGNSPRITPLSAQSPSRNVYVLPYGRALINGPELEQHHLHMHHVYKPGVDSPPGPVDMQCLKF